MSAQLDSTRRTIRERVTARADAEARRQVPLTHEWNGSASSAPGYFDPRPGESQAAILHRLESMQRDGLIHTRTNLRQLDPGSMHDMERFLLGQAREAAHTSGHLYRVRNRLDSGEVITRIDGDPDVWMHDFKAPGIQIRINPRAGQHYEEGRWVPDGCHLEEVDNA